VNNNEKTYNNSKIKFCFAGRLEKSKGIIELLEATKNLASEYSNFRLIIAGGYTVGKRDSISESNIQSLKQHKLIEYLGNIPHSEINNLYQKTDVFVLPSYREGLSKAALEAASNGMALIVADVPGCRECIDNNGLLVKARDSRDLAEKMEYFINNYGAVEELGRNSKKNIAEKYSLEKISKKYLDLIN
jgi:glycosyltransferase involved in cell wall biosynthesis